MSDSRDDRAESIRRRLRNRLSSRGEDMQLGLQRYAIERFLFRLGVSPHRDLFVLKGATLFALWGGGVYRPTRDLDFTAYGSADERDVFHALREICQQPGLPEELVFDADTLAAEPIRDDSEYHGLRITLEATLAKSRIPIRIDIGFGNAIQPPPEEVEYPTLLDDPAPRIRAYPVEAVLAEKLHAMVLLGERNSRHKDFYDIYVLASQQHFESRRLERGVAATFERRKTIIDDALPLALTPQFFANEQRAQQWRGYLTRNSLPGAPADFAEVGEMLRSFLVPIWTSLATRQGSSAVWPPRGPWRAFE